MSLEFGDPGVMIVQIVLSPLKQEYPPGVGNLYIPLSQPKASIDYDHFTLKVTIGLILYQFGRR